jgi:hypothetical protein
MSDAEEPNRQLLPEDDGSSGFNLKLAYALLAIALIGAICIALFIVLPFYHRH